MLTVIAVRNAQPKSKSYRLFDERGLYLEIMPNGAKYWRLKYRFNAKDKRFALGVYPEVSLAEARDKRDKARKLVAAGTDPAFAKKEDRRQRTLRSVHTFEAVARVWHKDHLVQWAGNYGANTLRRLERDIFPHIGDRPIAEVTPLELLEAIKKIEKRGAHEVARRCLRLCGQIYKHAIPNGLAERNPAADLAGALVPYKKTHYAALDKRINAARKLREAEDKLVKQAAREEAARIWQDSPSAFGKHFYLIKKGVKNHGLRLYKKALVIPLRDSADVLHSLQFIDIRGKKRFLTGGRKKGCYFIIGEPAGTLCIAEGYATAASIYEATGYATAVAFDAGNLLPVAQALREKFPTIKIIICADNDVGTPGNPGLTSARSAAAAVGAFITFPEWTP